MNVCMFTKTVGQVLAAYRSVSSGPWQRLQYRLHKTLWRYERSKGVVVLQSVAIGNSMEKATEDSKLVHDASAGELQWMRNVCEAPVFHPSVEEFRDPVAYIRSIRAKAEPFGLCKIVPPYPATTQCFEALRRDAGHSGNIGVLKLTTRQQLIGEKEWEDWGEDRFWAAPERSLKAFHQAADATATKVFDTCLLLPPRRVEVSSDLCPHLVAPCVPQFMCIGSLAGRVLEADGKTSQGQFIQPICRVRGKRAWNWVP
jgi:hypothetical protein